METQLNRGPIDARERLVFMDGLRGLALMGIFLVNMGLMAEPSMAYGATALWDGPIAGGGSGLRHFFGDGSFIFIFAMLFGAGFSMMIGSGRLGLWGYYRRLSLIGVFGFLHVALLWWGDVLMAYAVAGVFLPLFRKRKVVTQLIWAVLLTLGLTLLFVCLMLLPTLVMDFPEDWWAEYEAETLEWVLYLLDGYRSTDFAMVVEARWAEFDYTFGLLLSSIPMALGYMLVGQIIAQRGCFRLDAGHDAFFSKLLRFAIVPAVVGKLVYVYGVFAEASIGGSALFMLGYIVGGPAMGLVYLCALRRLFMSSAMSRIREGLAAAGRMALTNYLLQSALAGFLFYGYGLGLYGSVGPSLQVAIAFAFFALQMWGSTVWLRRYRMGPLEWLLRRWTYL